jgi:hypothetical protein
MGQKNLLFSIEGKEGENIYNIISQVLMAQGESFIINKKKHPLTHPILLHKVDWPTALKFLKNNFNIHLKKNKNTIEIQDNNNPIWQKYSLNIINYQYKMDSKINAQNQDKTTKVINNPYSLSYEIVNNHDVWNEIEANIKAITHQYFINKTTGVVGVYTCRENHSILKKLFQAVEQKNTFFFTITVKFWIVKSHNSTHDKPFVINNHLLDQVQNILLKKPQDAIKFFHEDQWIAIDGAHEHKLSTLNNIPVVFNNQMETITRYQEKQEEIFKNRKSSRNVHVTEKVYEGMTLYIHPLLFKKKILVYFLPIIIDKLGDNIFYNKSLSSTFFVENNKTFVLGGFTRQYQYNKKDNTSLLNRIPILGYFFKKNSKNIAREQLIITINININRYEEE